MTDVVTEKQRRIYYQDIVYAVCNIIDRNLGGSLWVGSVDDPSTEVQDTLAKCRIRFRDGDDSQWMDADKVDDLGLWWWFNGEQVIAVEIGISRNNDGSYSYFAYLGQHGWTLAQNVTEMGGKWHRCIVPEAPL